MVARNPALLTSVQLAGLRSRLLAARRRVLRTLGSLRDGPGTEGGERVSEFEESSRRGADAALQSRLAEGEFARLRRIEGALHRMVLQTYGLCTRSSSPIGLERLKADPAVALCPDCAAAAEAEALQNAAGSEEERGERGEVPADLNGFDDAEIAELVRETFRQELGGDLDEVRVACRHGLVILGGEVASDGLRGVALQMVEDELGLEAVDHLRVNAGLAETRERGLPLRREALDPDEIGVDASDGEGSSSDLFTVDEDGLSYTPSSIPVASFE